MNFWYFSPSNTYCKRDEFIPWKQVPSKFVKMQVDMSKTFVEDKSIFQWNPMDGIPINHLQEKIDSMYMEIKMNPDIEMKALQVLSYLYSIGEKPNHVKALELINQATEICNCRSKDINSEYVGYKFVALGNKVCILKELKASEEEISKIINERKSLQPLSVQALAGICGLKGYTMTLFGDTKYLEGLRSFQAATEFDSNNYEWPLGICILAKRLRLKEEGRFSFPTDMEEELLKHSVHLSDWKKAIPIMFLADVYFSKGRGVKGKGSWSEDSVVLMKTAINLYERAHELAPDCTHVLKRCGRAFSCIGESEMAKKYLLKGLELDQDNPIILHKLGQVYEHSKPEPNLALAEKYYSLSASGKKHVFADLDLARIRNKIDAKYNVINHCKEIRQHYLNNPQDLVKIDNAIKQEENRKKSSSHHSLRHGQHNHLKSKSFR